MTGVTNGLPAAGAQPDFHARRTPAQRKGPHDRRFGQTAGSEGEADWRGNKHESGHCNGSRWLPYADKGDLISPDLGE